MKTNRSRIVVIATLVCGWTSVAVGQGYPGKPVRFVIGGQGAPQDVTMRTIQPRLIQNLGQPVIIDYRANSLAAHGEIARSAADGYTAGAVADAITLDSYLYKDLPYDGLNAFSPVAMLIFTPMLLVSHPGFAPANLPELIAYSKANPGRVTYGSPAFGSRPHIGGVLLASRAGINMLHVPYKGAAAHLQGLIAGDLNVTFLTPATALPQSRAGKIRLLAVTSKARWAPQPDLPTLAEVLPGFELSGWFGVVGPARMSAAVVARLNREIRVALAQPDVTEKLNGLGVEAGAMSAEEFGAFMLSQSDTLGKVIREFNIKVE